MKFALTSQEVEVPLVAKLEVDKDGDLVLVVAGQNVLFLNKKGELVRWQNRKLAELGFHLDGGDRVKVGE